MQTDEARRIADAHGLAKLTGAQLDQFAETIKNNDRLVAGLPKDLHWSDEPAHVLRLVGPKERKS